MQRLSDEAADALLLQPGDHPLTIPEAAQARQWAGGHPCLLQVAGEAWYEAKDQRRSGDWATQRFQELRQQNCYAGHVVQQATMREKAKRPNVLIRLARAVFISAPLRVGRLAQSIGLKWMTLLPGLLAWL